MNTLLITGASGFLGSHLLKRISPARYKTVYCLSRSDSRRLAGLSIHPGLKFLRGSLFDVGAYERELARSDAILHLAAVTGKAPRSEYFKVNVEGTRTLVQLCQKLGVKRFLYVSSIAARFANKNRYYYAQSKEQAEEIVRHSGLSYTIIRPTIILSPGAPVWKGLSRLARLPIIPVFGDGKTLIQPILVEDLVDFILALLERGQFEGETLELGGPQVIPIEEFLKKVHRLSCRSNPRTVHIPFALVVPLLTLLEIPFSSLLPVTVGQLASFRCDGTIQRSRLFAERVADLRTIDEMLAALSLP